MLALLTALAGPLVQGLQALWKTHGERLVIWFKAKQEARLEAERDTAQANLDARRQMDEGQRTLDEARRAKPERFTSSWWDKGAGIVLLALAFSACSTVFPKPPVPTPAQHVIRPRPPFPGLTEAQRLWLQSLVEAYEGNCVALETLSGTSPKRAVERCTVD